MSMLSDVPFLPTVVQKSCTGGRGFQVLNPLVRLPSLINQLVQEFAKSRGRARLVWGFFPNEKKKWFLLRTGQN